MRKILLIVCFLYAGKLMAGDVDIERLTSSLPALSGKEKLKCLMAIAHGYNSISVERSDSALIYCNQAVLLCRQSGYRQELANATDFCGTLNLQASRANEAIINFRELYQLGHELKNEAIVARAIRQIGQSLWYQGHFQQAIDTISLAIDYFSRAGRIGSVVDAKMIIGSIYGEQGNYEKAFETSQEALTMSLASKVPAHIIISLIELGKLYDRIGDHVTAMEYYKRGYSYHPPKNEWSYRHLSHCMGDVYLNKKQYDSALYYYRESFYGNSTSKLSSLKMGQYFLALGQYDSSMAYFTRLYPSLKESGEGNLALFAMIGISRIHLHKKNYPLALQIATEVLTTVEAKNARRVIPEASELLSSIYAAMKQPDKALYYYKRYVETKDSIVTDQFKGKLFEFRRMAADEKKLAEIDLLKRQKMALAIGIAILILLGMAIVRSVMLRRKNEKLRNDKIQSELEHRAAALEMQALRAQMNPHFIFNCLSSINRFIIKNEPDIASDYLTRFSRLIRLVLINSQKPLILLEDEIEMLQLYIGLEQLRFRNSFDYNITYANDIRPGDIMVPPLVLQPFCENAIWHGLMHKEDHGLLEIVFTMQNESLHCRITDNGIGRVKAAQIKTKSGEKIKSMGLKLTTDRLALFNQNPSIQTFFQIEDLVDEDGEGTGTQVVLEISYRASKREKITS